MRSKTFIGVIIAVLAIIMVSTDAMALTKKSSTTSTAKKTSTTTTSSASPTFYITEEGIDGVVKLGDSYTTIPQKVDGLYEVLNIEKEGYDSETGEWSGEYYITFGPKKKGKPYFYATTDGNGNISSIWIGIYLVLKAKVNDQIISLDSTYSSLSKLPGAKTGVDPTGHFPATFIGKIEFVQENDWKEGPKDKISQVILRR